MVPAATQDHSMVASFGCMLRLMCTMAGAEAGHSKGRQGAVASRNNVGGGGCCTPGSHLRTQDWAGRAAWGAPRCAGRPPGSVRARRSDSIKDAPDDCHSRPVHKHPLQGRPHSFGGSLSCQSWCPYMPIVDVGLCLRCLGAGVSHRSQVDRLGMTLLTVQYRLPLP